MSLQTLNLNVSRLTQRLTENFKESTRDMPILHGGAGSSSVYFESPSAERLDEVGRLLDSRVEGERLEGMKRVIAMISKNRDMSAFFPQVVKNVATPSVEIRKLVYIYLLRYASTNPDLLLLSINTFQKDLSDPSPLIRSMSLRVLTSIRLPMIQGLVMIGLRKLAGDRNPWVRKSVAGGLIKVYDMDATTQPILLPILSQLLSLPSPITLGASLQAFLSICPDNLAFLHAHFRQCCALLIDADEWGQAVALDVLLRYARAMLEKPEFAGAVPPEEVVRLRAGRKVEPGVNGDVDGKNQDGGDVDGDELDPDLHLLLYCSSPLFQSRNPAVVLAATRLFYELAPAKHEDVGQERLVLPLLRLVDGPVRSEISAIAVGVCREMSVERPWLFAPHHTRFLPLSSDSIPVTRKKIATLRSLVNVQNADFLIREFKEYVRSPASEVSRDAIQAVGHCARTQSAVRPLGLGILMKLLKSNRETSVGQAVIVLKSLIQQSVQDGTMGLSRQLTSKLVSQLQSITNASARACVFWLAGQYAEHESSDAQVSSQFPGLASWAPDTLRLGVQAFTTEESSTKLQVLTLAAKVITICPTAKPLALMSQYLFSLARYDSDWDVRDRARFLNALLRGIRKTSQANTGDDTANAPFVDDEDDMGGVILRREQVKSVLLGERLRAADVAESTVGSPTFHIDLVSLSALAGKKLQGYAPLPDWSDDPTDSPLRDIEEDHRAVASAAPPRQSDSTRGAILPPSISSSPASLPHAAGNGRPAQASAANTTGSSKGSKFQDLDAFLDGSDEDESEEDDSSEEDVPEIIQRVKESLFAPSIVQHSGAAANNPEYSSEEESDGDSAEDSVEEPTAPGVTPQPSDKPDTSASATLSPGPATKTLRKRIVMIAVGGPTCSGKTLLAKHLARILPNCFLMHQDDFAPAQELIPYHPDHPDIQDWDTPSTAIDWPLFRRALQHARQTGQPLPGQTGHDHLNKQVEVPISEEVRSKWVGVFEREKRDWDARGDDVRFVIVDGFLLYWDEECASTYDVKLFLRVSYDTLKARREARQQYVTQSDVWLDPPHYFDDIVYPAYRLAHAQMFTDGDVELGPVSEEFKVGVAGKGMRVIAPGEGESGMDGMVDEGLSAVESALRVLD